ncbi:MAG: efflux transporter outer membrane subunit [Pseudomonadota bacterium]
MKRAGILIAAALLAGCSQQPKYVRGEVPVPPSWPVGDAYLRQSEAALPTVTYRDVFRDPRLQRIIDQALANNRDLRIAAANIVSARAQYRIQRADQFPQVDAGAGASFRDSGSGSGTTGTTTGTPTGTGTGTGTGTTVTTGSGFRDTYSADIGVSAFEIDLFGRVRSLSDAALNRYFATEAAARSVRLTLVADIAAAWVTYASDKSLLAIAEQTVASAGNSVRLTDARREGGIAPRTDLRQAQLVLEQAKSDLAQQTTALAQDVNALQLLVGAPVDAVLLPASIEQAETTLADLPAGVDSAVLLRRPDVVQAEYTLRAANADIGAARAALFPRISLTALLGVASGGLTGLFDGGNFSYSVAPSVDYPIFRAGAGRAGVTQARADRDAALAQYERAIQTAFREVADALARRGTIDAQAGAQVRLVEAAADNYRLSEARYRGGIDTFLQSLDAQRSLYQAQRSLVGARLVRATNRVDLYRRLGADNQLDASQGAPQEIK